MRTNEELKALKEAYDKLCKEMSELTEEELQQVTGGRLKPDPEKEAEPSGAVRLSPPDIEGQLL